MVKGFAGIALTALVLMGAGAPAMAADCSALANLFLENTQIDKAELVAAGTFQPPASPFGLAPGVAPANYKNMPAFCRVAATLKPTSDSDIKIEVWMPARQWNGKLVGIGNGVWAGTISYSQMAGPVSRGYAAVSTDTGHVGNGMDAGWAVGHREKLVDFGYRAVHAMTVAAKSLIEVYYARKPIRSYWTSCSTGGRQGLMEAYRYPNDYDGISAMAPANPMTDLMTQSIWTGYAAHRTPESSLTREKLAAVHKAFIQTCDARDGLKDGLVSDPEACHFDPAVAQCKGADGPDCLTAAQVETMRAIYHGPVNPKTGKQILQGFEPGSENQVGLLALSPMPFPVALTYMQDIVFHDPKWDYKTFNYDTDTQKARDAGASILDVPSIGLVDFFARGGKLLLSHGWADGLIPSLNTVAFYDGLVAHLGKPAATQTRLFMVPGMGHCGGGDGPFVWDPLSVIDAWVEEGKAPKRITVSNPPNMPARTRPLCPYPQVAAYKGSGSTDDAANFACKAPAN